MATATSLAQRMDLITLLLLGAAGSAAVATPPAFHSIVSARLPCVNNACENSTLDGRVCPCLQLSNSFGGAEVEHWQIRSKGPNAVWPLNGSDPNHCNTTDFPLICATPPALIAKALKNMAKGQRTIAPIDLYAARIEDGKLDKTAAWDTDANGAIMPFADEWQRVVGKRMDAWFGAYKAAGGEVDVVLLDIESLIFGFGHVFAKGEDNAKLFAPWQADPRWAGLLADLTALGSQYGVSFDNMTKAADTACCNSEMCEPGCDTTLNYYYVWNAVMSERVAKMINQTLYEPIAKHFPDVEMSNFDQSHYDSSPAYWTGSLNSYVMPPIGSGVHIGTHSSLGLYGGDGNRTANPLLTISTPTYSVSRTNSPYGKLLFNTRQVRSMVKGGAGIPVSPWIEPANGTWYPSHTSMMAHSPLYQESLLHMAMAGVKRFLWWRWSGDLLPEDGMGSSLLYGIHKANCVMAEADAMVGDAARVALSISDKVAMEDGYILSGMRLGNGTQVWRFTPSDEVQTPALRIITATPATFEVAGHRVVPVAGGRLLEAPAGSCSPAGYWIVLDKGRQGGAE